MTVLSPGDLLFVAAVLCGCAAGGFGLLRFARPRRRPSSQALAPMTDAFPPAQAGRPHPTPSAPEAERPAAAVR